MITRENFREFINSIDPQEIENAMNDKGDYIFLKLSIFNTGYYLSISSHEYNLDLDNEASENGNLFCDKSDFESLLKEYIEIEF